MALLEYIAHLSVGDWDSLADDLVALGFLEGIEGDREALVRRCAGLSSLSWLAGWWGRGERRRLGTTAPGVFAAASCGSWAVHLTSWGTQARSHMALHRQLLPHCPALAQVEPLGVILTQLSAGGGAKKVSGAAEGVGACVYVD